MKFLCIPCDTPMKLQTVGPPAEASAPKKLTLPGRKTVLFDLQGKSASTKGKKTLEFQYRVANLLVAPERPLSIPIRIDVAFTPAAAK